MIHYAIKCHDGHSFDGWFANSAAFDDQVARGLVTCPVCGSADVKKAIMAPNVSAKTRAKGANLPSRPAVAEPVSSPPAATTNGAAVPVTNAAQAQQAEKVLAVMRAVRRAVEANAENVGDRFAEEARKIHYGETDEKPIYGEAKPDEAIALIEEGIDVHPLPVLPEDKN